MKKRFITLAVMLFAGCDSVHLEQTLPTLPVSTMELSVKKLYPKRELSGIVSHYREQKVGFEVSGRVTMVLDEGIEVHGPAFNESGKLIRRGDAIAVMEGSRYGSQVGVLQAQVNAARRDLQAAGAELTLAKQILKRQKMILQKGIGIQQDVDDAQSRHDQTQATLEAKRASVVAVEQQLDSAVKDLGDSVLYAPFSGRITKVHIAEGAVVSPGEPIATLTLMDPMQVQMQVSADVERSIQTGDSAVVYLKDPLNSAIKVPLNAVVYEKSTVADPKLRTYQIVLMIRNNRHHVYDRDDSLRGLPMVDQYLPAIREYQGEEGPLFVPTDALFEENGQNYVLRLPGVGFKKGSTRSAVGKHMPERVAVSLTNEYTNVVQWNFRSIVDEGLLSENEFLVMNPQANYVNGIVIGRPMWLLRPRDIVPVQFNSVVIAEGFYVPNHAVILIDEQPHVYRVEEDKSIATPVNLHESAGDYRRISSELLQSGSQIVIDGVHYLTDGQPITVVEVE
jgi:RND family efflux transporter MFP subunit